MNTMYSLHLLHPSTLSIPKTMNWLGSNLILFDTLRSKQQASNFKYTRNILCAHCLSSEAQVAIFRGGG